MDAILVFPSMPAVMRLNKLGSFAMEQLGQGKSIIKDFMRSQRKNNENFEESLLQLVRTLPKVHPLCSLLLALDSYMRKENDGLASIPDVHAPCSFAWYHRVLSHFLGTNLLANMFRCSAAVTGLAWVFTSATST